MPDIVKNIEEGLSHDPGCVNDDGVVVRSLAEGDAEAIARIDATLTGRSRSVFFKKRIESALQVPGVSLSQVAEFEGSIVGFLLASVDYGEFGTLDPVATLDAIGVDPKQQRLNVASALYQQLTQNLKGLAIDRVRTEVHWKQWDLLGFLQRNGFEQSPRISLEAHLNQP